MTRNEEIEQASKQGSIECFGYEEGDYTIPFRHGAEWADRTRIEYICNWIYQHSEAYLSTNNEGTWFDSNLLINDLKKAVSSGESNNDKEKEK